MARPPNRKCWSAHREMHIGTCFDAWTDPNQVCVCNPADQAEYPNTQRLYVGATITGVGNANIKTYFDGAFSKTHRGSGDYMHVWWESGGWYGDVRFDLCSGDTVIASRSTEWVKLVDPTAEANGVVHSFSPNPNKASAGESIWIETSVINSGNANGQFIFRVSDVDTNDVVINTDTISINAGGQAATGRSILMPDHDWNLLFEVVRLKDGSEIIDDTATTTVVLVEPDSCKDVICEPECVGVDMYDTVCDEGVCIRGVLLEKDSAECGYEPPEPEPEPAREETYTINNLLDMSKTYESHGMTFEIPSVACLHQECWISRMYVNGVDRGKIEVGKSIVVDDVTFYLKSISPPSGLPFVLVLSGSKPEPEPEPEPPLQPVIPGMPEPEEPEEPEPAPEEPEPTDDTMIYIYVAIGVILVFMMLRGS